MKGGASNFRRIYPNQESITFEGGLDNKFEKALIPDNESPDCQDVIFINESVTTRDGAVKLNTTPCGTNVAFDGLYSFNKTGGSETMIAFAGGHMFTLAATTFVTVPSAQSVFTMGNRVACATEENYVFIGNGGVGPYKWDGSLFTQHGVPSPTSTATVVSNGVGALTANGQYQYVVTYVNTALVESNISPKSATFVISSTSGQNTVNNIPVAPASFGINARYLYRNASATPAIFQRVAKILDNTTTTFNDNVADSALGSNAPTDNGMPPQYNAILYHAGRLWMNDPANPNFVWYTNLFTPYTVASTNFFKVGDNTTDTVRGFAVYNNYLYIFCDSSIWINYMPDPSTPSNWRQIRSNSSYGSKSPFCLVGFMNRVLFPAVQNKKFVGFASTLGDTLDPSSTLLTVTTSGSQLQSDRIETDMFNVQEGYLGNISGIVFKNKIYITLTYNSGNQTNNRIYQYDFSRTQINGKPPSWVPWTGLNAAQFCVYGGKLYYASSDTSGFVFNIDGTGVYSDNGTTAINSYYLTKEFPGFEPDTNFYKDFRYANLLIDNAGAYYMNLTYRVDSDKGVGNTQQIYLNPGGSNWGTLSWGRDSWGGGTLQSEIRISLGELRGKRVQFKFSNQNVANQRFKVHRMNFVYNIKGYR